MPKYFKAIVTIASEFEVEVVGSDEAAAEKATRAIDFSAQTQKSSKISGVRLSLIGECTYHAGSNIEHCLFGRGVIKSLQLSTGHGGGFGHRATVEFEDGNIKEIHFPPPADKVKILD